MKIFLTYLSHLPWNRKCHSLYLQSKKKITDSVWYQDRSVGVNKLHDVVKEVCKTAGLPGFFTNHSL